MTMQLHVQLCYLSYTRLFLTIKLTRLFVWMELLDDTLNMVVKTSRETDCFINEVARNLTVGHLWASS